MAAMVRSALGRVSRRLAGSAVSPAAPRLGPPPATSGIQGLRYFSVIRSRGTDSVKQAQKIRNLLTQRNGSDAKLMELARSAAKWPVVAWFCKPTDGKAEFKCCALVLQ
uniref:Uncharacterized protein n=1 Tax=Leersia perrieri TaxID=77586 RepID=A0A0D9WUV9_9ORYZ